VIEIRIVQEITSWNEVAGAESAKPRLAMTSNQPWRRRLRHSHPPSELDEDLLDKLACGI
jgi:hypothetical protein